MRTLKVIEIITFFLVFGNAGDHGSRTLALELSTAGLVRGSETRQELHNDGQLAERRAHFRCDRSPAPPTKQDKSRLPFQESPERQEYGLRRPPFFIAPTLESIGQQFVDRRFSSFILASTAFFLIYMSLRAMFIPLERATGSR